MFEPCHDLALLIGLLHRDMRHETVGCGAVPMFLVGLDEDDVAGPGLRRLAAAVADEPDPVGDVERLALGGRVPGGPSIWAERTCAQPMAVCSSGFRTVSM